MPRRLNTSAKPPASPLRKRVHFRLPSGQVRVERVPAAEVAAFIQSLVAQGATEIRVTT